MGHGIDYLRAHHGGAREASRFCLSKVFVNGETKLTSSPFSFINADRRYRPLLYMDNDN
jgi:hypothetical protein